MVGDPLLLSLAMMKWISLNTSRRHPYLLLAEESNSLARLRVRKPPCWKNSRPEQGMSSDHMSTPQRESVTQAQAKGHP